MARPFTFADTIEVVADAVPDHLALITERRPVGQSVSGRGDEGLRTIPLGFNSPHFLFAFRIKGGTVSANCAPLIRLNTQ